MLDGGLRRIIYNKHGPQQFRLLDHWYCMCTQCTATGLQRMAGRARAPASARPGGFAGRPLSCGSGAFQRGDVEITVVRSCMDIAKDSNVQNAILLSAPAR